MEYDPEQIELLIQKVAFTHGSRLEDLFYQQKNILENHLNQLMIDHQGEAESITPEEIEGVYEIATIHVGHPSNFYGMESDCEELVGEVNHTTECVTDFFLS